MAAQRPLRVVSWNVNGLRAIVKKGFVGWLDGADADIVGLQETRASEAQVPEAIASLPYAHRLVVAERKGYSGVGLLSRRAPDAIDPSLGETRFDTEGRLQVARFGRLVIANVYFPNGNGKDRSNDRVPYKLDFYRAVFDRMQRMRRGGYRVLIMGDFNTSHHEIDLARPKTNHKTSGFLPEEREEFDRWIRAGWIDTFREFESGGGHYTWWSQRYGVRERNIGWRLDMVVASPNVRPFLKHAFIWPDVMGSDHCPVGVDLDPSVLG